MCAKKTSSGYTRVIYLKKDPLIAMTTPSCLGKKTALRQVNNASRDRGHQTRDLNYSSQPPAVREVLKHNQTNRQPAKLDGCLFFSSEEA